MPGSGDQYFNATMTFNPAPGSGMSEFQPYVSVNLIHDKTFILISHQVIFLWIVKDIIYPINIGCNI